MEQNIFGNRKLMENQLKLSTKGINDKMKELEEAGKTAMILATGRELLESSRLRIRLRRLLRRQCENWKKWGSPYMITVITSAQRKQ